jgi:uncharacterized protein YndB with AHSA1/START domain
MTDETISATTIINAPAEAIFAVLADPAKHAAIDGTGWVREPLDGQPLTAAGQVFRIAMYNDNVPGGHYRMANRVQVFDPPRAISWEPGMDTGDGNPQDHPEPRPPSPMTGRRSPTPSASDSHSHSPVRPGSSEQLAGSPRRTGHRVTGQQAGQSLPLAWPGRVAAYVVAGAAGAQRCPGSGRLTGC